MSWSDSKEMQLLTENFRKSVQKESYLPLTSPEEGAPAPEPAPAAEVTDWSRWARPWGGIENPTRADEYAHSAIFAGSGEGVSKEEHLERVAQGLKKAGFELLPAPDNPAVTSWQKRTGTKDE